jgi:hypothetical protein
MVDANIPDIKFEPDKAVMKVRLYLHIAVLLFKLMFDNRTSRFKTNSYSTCRKNKLSKLSKLFSTIPPTLHLYSTRFTLSPSTGELNTSIYLSRLFSFFQFPIPFVFCRNAYPVPRLKQFLLLSHFVDDYNLRQTAEHFGSRSGHSSSPRFQLPFLFFFSFPSFDTSTLHHLLPSLLPLNPRHGGRGQTWQMRRLRGGDVLTLSTLLGEWGRMDELLFDGAPKTREYL